jgi:uncharacterized protein YkwD
MKTRFLQCGLVLVTGLAAMSGNACPGGGTSVVGTMSAAEAQLATDALTAINTHRATQGLAAYTWYDAGAEVAYQHCIAMQSGNFFAHVNPNTGTDPATRALNAGITHDPDGSVDPNSGNPFVGENLYTATNTTPSGQAAVDGWIASPGHYTQIVAPQAVAGAQTMPAWTHCGIGVRVSGNQVWFTAMFFRNPN